MNVDLLLQEQQCFLHADVAFVVPALHHTDQEFVAKQVLTHHFLASVASK
jgi:hypothetical protein